MEKTIKNFWENGLSGGERRAYGKISLGDDMSLKMRDLIFSSFALNYFHLRVSSSFPLYH